MKTLKISFLQSTPDFGREGMLQLLKSRYHVVEDDSYFDYLVATPWFYVNREAFYDFLERPPATSPSCTAVMKPLRRISCCLTITSGSIRCPEATALSNFPTFATICRKCTAERKAWMPMLSWPPKRVSATSFTPTANPSQPGCPCSTSSPLSGSSIPWGPILTTPRRRPPGGRLVRILHQKEKAV